jgi:transposase
MPVVPSSIIDPIRAEFLALLPEHADTHPWGEGCHNPRIRDAVVFDKLVTKLVSGLGYERIADDTCSATTIRRRRDEWIRAGMGEQLQQATLSAYDRLIGLQPEHLAADGCITKAPSGGECAGKSPVDRAKQGIKRSQLTEGYGIPLVTDPAPANICDHILLPATLDALAVLEKTIGPLPEHPWLSLDAGYDYPVVYAGLEHRGLEPKIAKRGERTPLQADGRWVAERTHSWMNNFGLLRRCTERRRSVIEFFLALASAFITVRSLIRRAWTRYRWETRPRSPRIRLPTGGRS